MNTHPDVVEEQAYLDHAYRCLAAMRDRTVRAASSAAAGAAQEVDSAIAEWHLRQRLKTLDPDVPALSFGRLDARRPANAGTSAAATSRTTAATRSWSTGGPPSRCRSTERRRPTRSGWTAGAGS